MLNFISNWALVWEAGLSEKEHMKFSMLVKDLRERRDGDMQGKSGIACLITPVSTE